MGAIDWLCVVLGINKTAVLGGLLGGLLSLRWVGEVDWKGRVFAVGFAGMVANYATEPLYLVLAIKGLHQAGVAAMIALFSLSLASAIFKALNEAQLGTVLADAMRRVLGGGK